MGPTAPASHTHQFIFERHVMQTLLIVIIVLLVLAIFVLWRIWLNADHKAYTANIKYAALEIGMREQEENYEMQFLSFQEEILRLDHDLKILHVVAEHHADNCIPDYAPILGQSEYLTLSEHSENPDKYVDRLAAYVMEPHLG